MSEDSKLNGAKEEEKDKTNPFGVDAFPQRQKSIFFRAWFILGFMALAIAGIILYFSRLPQPKPVVDRVSVQLAVNEIIGLEEVVRQEQKHLADLLPQLREQYGIDSSTWPSLEPPAETLTLLEAKAGTGKGAAADYLAACKEIRQLTERIHKQEAKLGTPKLVASGDSHFQIAYDFLVAQRHLNDDQAREILKGAKLKQPVLPGFKVWNFWLPDGFATFVTRGDAPITPEDAMRQDQEKQRLDKTRALLRLNLLHYIVGSLAQLQHRGILSGGFLKSTKLAEVPPEEFGQAIDLREHKRITLTARSVGLKKISALSVFPHEFKEGEDFKVTIGLHFQAAFLVILKAEHFRGRRIVIAVE